jgi:putative spermidine/putrescine transport system ATP-binding protein
MFRDSASRAPGEPGGAPHSAQPSEQPLKLRIAGVSKRYGEAFALRPSDLDIRQGEFVTLLGPSGSGKTTLLMMIAGLVHPTSGDIWIDGRNATRQQPYERDVGMMFQSYALFPHMTVGENIAFPLKMRRASQESIRTAVDEVLQQIKLPGIRNRFPSELSGGQQQRVALARSIVHRPSVVLMDEPLAALDKSLRAHMQLEIRQLQQELGITVLYVTHDQEEAMTMSDRICLMNEARIEQVATPAELYFSPRTVFAAGFVGESNSFDGTIEAMDGPTAHVRLSFGHVAGRAMGAAKAGNQCKVMIRPEAVGCSSAPAASGQNCIAAEVTSHVIAGAIARTYLRTSDGRLLVSTGLTRRTAGASMGSVWATFQPEDTLVYGDAS